jgi:hypothetical protein
MVIGRGEGSRSLGHGFVSKLRAPNKTFRVRTVGRGSLRLVLVPTEAPPDDGQSHPQPAIRGQCVTTFRHTAGKSYPSPEWYGRAASCTRSRTASCAMVERDRSTGAADADVSVR